MHHVQTPGQRVLRHEAPATIDDALALLEQHGLAARAIAGGTDLLVELARSGRPGVEVLVDLTGIAGLDTIESRGGVLTLGALVTHNDVIASPDCIEHALALAQASWEVAAPALRNRATVVGNVVTASPANDTISALTALDARVVIQSLAGIRRVRVADLYIGVRATHIQPGELVVAIEIPIRQQRSLFAKLGQRRSQAISVVHVAIAATFSDDNTVDRVRIALGSVAPVIVSATQAEAMLTGSQLDEATIAEAARLVAAGVTPISDVRGTAVYRSVELEVLVRRMLRALRDNAQRSQWPAIPVHLRRTREVVPQVVGHNLTSSGFGWDTPVACSINAAEVQASDAAGRTLLDWLRDTVGLTGTKEGCAEGECGACTVHLDGTAVLACLVPAVAVHGRAVTTIEGLGTDADLHPLQQAFIDQYAVQCGFCIPGFLMAGAALVAECPAPTIEQVTQGLSGNLCRCTGYYRFYDAVQQVTA